MSTGRHAKPKNSKTAKQIAIGATVLLGGSVVSTTNANAATDDQWERIAACESGDMNVPGSARWNLPYGDADSTGGLQIQTRTWLDFGGSEFAPQAYQASKAQQIVIAEKVLAQQGSSAWVCNSPGHGIASGALAQGSSDATVPPPPPPPPEPQAKPPDTNGTYVVKRGDWLAKIADHQGVKGGWETLYAHNKDAIGPDPDLIYPGQKLALPVWSGAKPSAPAKPKPSGDYVLPVKGSVGDSLIIAGSCISRTCGGHSGLDITAPQGTPVLAASAGVVVSVNASGWAYGTHVVIKHADGLYTLYGHMSARSVSLGQSVSAGQQVGNVGSTGTSSGPHLHFEVRNHPTNFSVEVFLNPVSWLRSHGVTV